MPKSCKDFMELPTRPRWDRDGGIWYPKQGVPTGGSPQTMYRHKPSVNSICEPLLGSPVRNASGTITGVKYPPLEERCRLFREGIELVQVFRDYDDLFTLATFRRQVTQRGGIPMDLVLFNLACDANFSRTQWKDLANRMPDASPIKEACTRRAVLGPQRLRAA